jgi:hypothetical protein
LVDSNLKGCGSAFCRAAFFFARGGWAFLLGVLAKKGILVW